MLLRILTPMYETGGWEDPWTFWSVSGKKETDRCLISSASRFGIGDVTFLATATGRCEYVEDTLKRFNEGDLHLNGGTVIMDIQIIVKALGLLADFACDKMHSIKQMIGIYPQGVHRRIIAADPLGMHFANITTLSAGLGQAGTGKQHKMHVEFPKQYQQTYDMISHMLQTSVANENKPAFQYTAQYATSVSMLWDGACPMLTQAYVGTDNYFHDCVEAVLPLEMAMAECRNSWDAYQEEWRAQGYDHDYVPYPYTMDMMRGWLSEYENKVGPLSNEDYDRWFAEKAKDP